MINFDTSCRSIFFFIISIMAFVWRTGTIEDASQTPLISHDALAPRIIVTCLFSLGLVYLIFIRFTFQRYGSTMDRAWRTRVLVWIHQNFDYNISIDSSHSLQKSSPSISKLSSKPMTGTPPHSSQNALPASPVLAVSESFMPEERPRGRSTSIKPISTFVEADHHSAASRKSVIKLTKILGLSADDPSADVIPSNEMLMSYQMTKDDWERLFSVCTLPPFAFLVGSYRSYRKFALLGILTICPWYKTLSSAGTKPSLANEGHKSFYAKNLVYPGSSMRYIIFLGRINSRLLKIHMIPFPKT